MTTIHDGPAITDDPAPRECQFEDPRTGKECGADGTIYVVGILSRGVPSDPIDVCGAHLPAVIVNPPKDPNAMWAVMVAQDIP